jgi:hypothetical protein
MIALSGLILFGCGSADNETSAPEVQTEVEPAMKPKNETPPEEPIQTVTLDVYTDYI